ncbi:ATP-binding protein [Stenotrophomonas beteli]|uniref:ATP-binding protein n=1 Tax=Stenotrophomonas beteli TaxID=3384461 RepID=UPI0009B4B7B2
MRRGGAPRQLALIPLLLALLLLPGAAADDATLQHWHPNGHVRVAVPPSLHPMPATLADWRSPATLAHGYAELVSRRTHLVFEEIPYPSIEASIRAVCRNEAELVMVFGGVRHRALPCPDLIASGAFPGGATLLAARAGTRLPRDVRELHGRTIAVVQGGPFAGWLAAHHPQIHLHHFPDRHATLAAVVAGLADVAIGLESTLRPMARRYFKGRLQLQALQSDFSSDLHLLVRHQNEALLRRIDKAVREITLDEHASLLHLWAEQALPAPFGEALRWARQPPALAWVALVPLLAAALLLWRLRSGRDRLVARAAGMFNHEMRNAAQAMLSAIELLAQSPLRRGQGELLGVAKAAGQSLSGLLNRALDFSRLAAGAFTPRPRPCDVTQLCQQVLDAVDPQARRKGLRLDFAAPAPPSPNVLVDPDALRQITSNLLINAVKFSDAGSVELRLDLVPPARPRELLLEVIDSGIGIAPETLEALFQPFQQGAGGKQRGGSGLGLAICRELARAMGGELTVHSVLGRGSRFILRLPVRATRAATDPAPARALAAPLAGMALLLAEDHALNRRVVAEQLRQLGADVCAVADAAAALAEQARNPRTVMLLDIGLRGMDGHALARELRRQSGTPLRLIALSARTGRRHLERCRASGFDAVLTKPLRPAQLLQALQLHAPAGAAPAEATIATDSLLAAYLSDIGNELANIEGCLRDRNADTLRHHAHRLQGTLQMLGAHEQAALAAALWDLGQRAAPDWEAALHLLEHLRGWHGARTADALPSP